MLKVEYQYVLSLLFNNFDDIIHLLKEKEPFYGEILEHLYMSIPLTCDKTHERVMRNFTYMDDILRMLFKEKHKDIPRKFRRDVKSLCEKFHIAENEFEYYYFIALAIVSMESSINEDAYNVYSQLDSEIAEMSDGFVRSFLGTITVPEFQCLFYNHLEDIEKINTSEDGRISSINNLNCSPFLENNFFHPAMRFPVQGGVSVPIVISRDKIYNIVQGKPRIIGNNNIEYNIFGDSVIYAAHFFPVEKKIRFLVPIFSYFGKYTNLTNRICDSLFNSEITWEYDNPEIWNSQSFAILDSNPKNLHYFVQQMTVYQI